MSRNLFFSKSLAATGDFFKKIGSFFSPAFGKIKYVSQKYVFHFAGLSVAVNAILAMGKIGMGIYSLSVFLCINGLYNIGIGFAKATSIKWYLDRKKAPDEHRKDEYRVYFIIGMIILAASILYMAYCIRLLMGNHSNIKYSDIVAITIATFTFTEVGMAVHGIVTTRKNREPIMEAVKLTNFAASLISLVLTEAALLSFTYEGNSSVYCGITGIIFGGVAAMTGLYMMVHITRIIHGKNVASMIKKANKIIKKAAPDYEIEAVKYEDNGPDARTLYLHMHNEYPIESYEKIRVRIISKLNIDVMKNN